jgi:hypothetical protein
MSATVIIILCLAAFGMLCLGGVAYTDRRRQQEIADQHWRDVEHKSK